MTLVLAATPGLSIDMSQTNQQPQGAAPVKAKPRKDWELFWRIIAGLMIVVIAWIIWVLYQITPRSVVTPLVYESQVKRGGTQQSETGAAAASPQLAPAKSAGQQAVGVPPLPQPTSDATAAALLMDQAQAALRSGAHQSSADVQAAALEQRIVPIRGERLKLSTEITTPLVEKKSVPKQQKARPDGVPPVPATTAGKIRP
ncbi:MAG: hypothetical protein A3G80_00400 [Betaproteobacteria bacterium RIFCSPLOWO2_12_FULL_62_13b]|nr:MAG: hypothetical protein A3G80_00400 [Betaproteobacteria bacterium RIFCSPLOWO2_12_FULL_62_13b]